MLVMLVIIGAAFGAFVIQRLSNAPCLQSAQSNIYLLVVNDTTHNALSGVQVSGSVSWLCQVQATPPAYSIASLRIGPTETNSSGLPIFLGSIIGNYSLTLSYAGRVFHASFGSGAEANVNVNIGLPSVNVSEVYCIFGGGTCFSTSTLEG
jgi:hypothetical protein